jgi:hypothetical protein
MSNGAVVVVGGQTANAAVTTASNTFTQSQQLNGGWSSTDGLGNNTSSSSTQFGSNILEIASYYGSAELQMGAAAGYNTTNTVQVYGTAGTAQLTDAASQDTVVSATASKTLRLGAGLPGVNASTVQITASGTNFTGTISSGGTAGINATVTLAKLTTANGSLTVNNGLITAYTAPT